VYDETGDTDQSDDLDSENFDNLYRAYRSIYKKVTEDDIKSFAREYRGSEEERSDLISLYVEFEGSMKHVFDSLMLSRPEVDSHRFLEALREAEEGGEVPKYASLDKWAKKVAKMKRVADPLGDDADQHVTAEEGFGEGEGGGGGSLVALIQARAQDRKRGMDDMCDALLAKYGGGGAKKGKKSDGGGPKRGKKGKAADAVPSEEDFLAAQKRLRK